MYSCTAVGPWMARMSPGGGATVGEGSTCAHEVVFLYEDLLGEGDKVFLDLAELGGNDDFAVAALDGAHRDLTVDFGNDCGIGGVAGFEEFGDTGQTTGDVAGRTDYAGILTMMSPAFSTC